MIARTFANSFGLLVIISSFRLKTTIYLELWKVLLTFVILSITFIYIQSVGRHGLSIGERPQHFRPQFLRTKSYAGLVYLQLSPAIQNYLIIFCYYPNTLNSNFFLLVIAIGLLVPRPYLIARLLGRQRRLSSWCTMVWNSHQLIPNMAYSPQGRLLRER